MHIQSTCLPVTCLQVIDGVLYYADGPSIWYHDGLNNTLFCTIEAIASVRVIRKCRGGIMCSAGQSLFKCSLGKSQRIEYGRADWILDLLVSDTHIHISDAHGDVTVLCANDFSVEKRYSISEYALFYSGHFIDACRVAFGTIFSGVWIYELSPESGLVLIKKLDKEHHGSVFSICSNSKHFFSGSDDRTIVMWDKNSLEFVKSFKGHDARVWSLCCTEECLVSGSEDGTVRLWSLLDDNNFCTLYEHQGKHVWSVAIDNHGYVYSGGGDGAVIKRTSRMTNVLSKAFSDVKTFHQTRDNALYHLNSQNVIMKNGEPYYQSEHLQKFCIFASNDDWLCIGDLTGRVHFVNRHTGRVSILSLSPCKLMKMELMSSFLMVQDAKMTIYAVSFDEQADILMKATNCFDRIITCIHKYGAVVLFGTRCGHVICTDYTLDLKWDLEVGMDSVTGFHLYTDDMVQFCTRGGQLGYIDISNGSLVSIEPKSFVSFEGLANHLVYGFHDKQFVMMDVCTKQVYFKFDCGGGHRLWQVCDGMFLYLRDSHLHSINLAKLPIHVIKPGLCGLETRAMAVFEDIMIMAGEDGSLFTVNEQLCPLYKIQFDTACKSICSLNNGDEFIVVGAKAMICRVKICKDGTIHILSSRSNSIDVVRHMCVVAYKDCLFVGCSDGSVKKYSTDLQDEASVFYECGNCVMSMALLDNHLYCGTSNGRLYIVSLETGNLVKCITDAHNGAIMCMTTGDDAVICGGDDGQVCIFVMHSIHLKWQAHNSTITGIFLAHDRLWTVSVDQRLCIHDHFMQNHLLTPFTRSLLLPITDASAMSVMPDGTVWVVGRGAVSLVVDCDGGVTCNAHTKRLRVEQSNSFCNEVSPTSRP